MAIHAQAWELVYSTLIGIDVHRFWLRHVDERQSEDLLQSRRNSWISQKKWMCLMAGTVGKLRESSRNQNFG